MENHQLALYAANMATASLTFLKKFQAQESFPAAAAVCDDTEQYRYCAICLNDICRGDNYRKLSECGHSFHCKCIDAWLRSHSTCPLCRAQLPQIISLHQNHHDLNDFMSNVLLLIQDFLRRMCNPLNQELSSMLCGNIS